VSGYSGKSLEILESFHMLWKVLVNLKSVWIDSRDSGQFINTLDTLESFWMPWNFLDTMYVKFPVTLKSVWKVSGNSRKFLDTLERAWIDSRGMERVWILWKVSGNSGKFPYALESFS
jgi:hypothetical protein